MAESTEHKRARSRRAVVGLAIVVVGLVATTAVAATVTQAPTISGTLEAGSTLTASSGVWAPRDATPSYSWLRCSASGADCAGISGASGRTYGVRTVDEGHTLRVRLTATQKNGRAASADSAPTAVVVARKPYTIPSEPATDPSTVVTPTGPGTGTFSSGTATGGGSEPSPGTSLPFIDPFPVIRIAGRFRGKRTTLTRVTVRAPRGTRIRINCTGRGCPYKRRATAVRLLRIRSLQRTYRPNATIEIRVTQPEKIGKYTRMRMRRDKAPLRVDRCLMPGKSKPVRCPAA